MRLKLPIARVNRHPVQDVHVDLYAERLLEYRRSQYKRIRQLMQDAADEAEMEAAG